MNPARDFAFFYAIQLAFGRLLGDLPLPVKAQKAARRSLQCLCDSTKQNKYFKCSFMFLTS